MPTCIAYFSMEFGLPRYCPITLAGWASWPVTTSSRPLIWGCR
ncbi:phosphorylase domain protein [Mycobacterium xenopi 4042]|uniref:Phosphorylase domain protein n=1 Tax=Mycobacterium xenopi 4042 TaxID=1299334 RepID=X8E3B5_MYCXE|nr:phosphorylase domain protein [Mycobacterium xenopi 4042]